MNKWDISVIIPTFNRLWSLPKTIESCQNTRCKTEIIVVDDGSTDGTWKWLKKQKGVKALRQANWGKDWAVNLGFAAAKGKYIRFLDSDDWLLEGANDGQFACASESNADIVVAGYKVFDEKQSSTIKKPWVYCDDFIAQQLGECDSSHYSAYLFKKKFIANIPHRQEFGIRDDRMFIIEAALKNPRISFYKKPAFVHRQHTKERLQSPFGIKEVQTNAAHLLIYQKAAEMLKTKNELTQRRKNGMAKGLWPLAHWIARTHLDTGIKIARWIYILNPEFEPPERGLLGYLYKHFGFSFTERLLAFRRFCVKFLR